MQDRAPATQQARTCRCAHTTRSRLDTPSRSQPPALSTIRGGILVCISFRETRRSNPHSLGQPIPATASSPADYAFPESPGADRRAETYAPGAVSRASRSVRPLSAARIATAIPAAERTARTAGQRHASATYACPDKTLIRHVEIRAIELQELTTGVRVARVERAWILVVTHNGRIDTPTIGIATVDRTRVVVVANDRLADACAVLTRDRRASIPRTAGLIGAACCADAGTRCFRRNAHEPANKVTTALTVGLAPHFLRETADGILANEGAPTTVAVTRTSPPGTMAACRPGEPAIRNFGAGGCCVTAWLGLAAILLQLPAWAARVVHAG